MSLLGIDIGTTGCKAAAFTPSGHLLALEYREYPTVHPQPGWAELDSARVWQAVQDVIASVAARSGGDPVRSLCISSLGEAMTPVSREGKLLGNSILSVDLRGAEHVGRLRAEMGQEAFYAINPNILAPNYSLPKLLWLREHRPQVFQSAWKFMLWGDLAGWLLGGEPVTSYAAANRTLLFDIHRQDWSDPLLAWAGLTRDQLPAVAPSGAVAGEVSDAMAARLGLERGVKIVVGAHDQCCNALGAGVGQAGGAVCGLGTVECITPVYDHIPPAAQMLELGLNVEHHTVAGHYVSFIYNQSGALVRWLRDTCAGADKALLEPGEDIYGRLCAEMPEGPTRLLALPHFEATGAPDFISNSAGVIAGLRMGTRRGGNPQGPHGGRDLFFPAQSASAGKTGGRHLGICRHRRRGQIRRLAADQGRYFRRAFRAAGDDRKRRVGRGAAGRGGGG